MSDRDSPGYLGLGGRLGTGPAPELVEAGFALEMAEAPSLHDGFGLADIAHTLALLDAGVLAGADGTGLLGALLEMAAMPADKFPYDAASGDPWNSRELILEELAGPAAGWLWVGRPRREAARVALRLTLRRGVLGAHGALLDLAGAYLAQARRHRDSVMSDSTYLQPAQPTTLGYVLAGHLQPVLRHLGRLESAYGWVNRSPAGAGGTTGGSVPVDRARLAASLGFDGVVDHARDAMWQTDGLVELLAVLAAAATEAGQVAADLEIWASPAYGFVDLADGYCRVSALMPQKKNPYALAVVRQAAGAVTGALAGVLSGLRTPTARTDHFLLAPGEMRRALGVFTTSTRLLAGVVGTLSVDKKALAAGARDPGLVLGDLADEMVVAGICDRRTAHRVLGEAARASAAEDRALTATDVAGAAGRAGLTLPPELLGMLADPVSVLRRRTVAGGWTDLPRLLTGAGRDLARHRRFGERTLAAIDDAESGLLAAARRLAAG
ncbi:MAG TPA: lyase family protein [Actinomycetes bacterium]|nr:lyase family protein [Actinomycetes bacterium]